MLISNPNMTDFKTINTIDESHPDSEKVRYFGQEVALGDLRRSFSFLERLSNMTVFYDDLFQYTSLGLLDLIFEIKKINSPLPIKDFFNRKTTGNEFVKKICSLWGISSEEVDAIENQFYAEILRRSPLSNNAVYFLKMRKSLHSQIFVFRHNVPNFLEMFEPIKDKYRAADGSFVSIEFECTNGKTEHDYIQTVKDNKIDHFEFTVVQDANSVIDFYEKNEYKNGVILTGINYNQLTEERVLKILNEEFTDYTVKFMKEGIA
jgi:hypothetical protein